MTLNEYENKQVALDNYEEYMIDEIQRELLTVDIEILEEVMDQLNIYNNNKEEER